MRMRPKGIKNKAAVQVSPSGLDSYFQCPARFKYSTICEPHGLNKVLQVGIEAHAILAGSLDPKTDECEFESIQYAETLRQLADENSIVVDQQEVTQMVRIDDNVYLKRIIDGIGIWEYATGETIPVLIDWKTSEKGDWPSFQADKKHWIAPKSWGFQAVSYLVPPADDELERLNLKSWPNTIVFIVGNTKGRGTLIPYSKGMDPEGEENFFDACRMFEWSVNNDIFPKYRGYACGILDSKFFCPFTKACYKIGRWKDEYQWNEDDDDGDWN